MPASTPSLPRGQDPAGRTGLRGRAFKLLILATAASFSGYILLLPTVPLWAARGGAGEFGAGSTTATFMLTTVLTQLAMPWLLSHGGYRWTFPAGALLLAAPTPLLILSSDLTPVIIISAVRGIGFGMVTVVGAAQSVRLVAPAQLGRAAAYYGAAVGIPILVFLSLGVWLALNVSFAAVFWTATFTPLVGAVAAVALWYAGGARMLDADATNESRTETGDAESGAPARKPAPSTGRIWLALITPLLLMLALALASSAIVTFLSIPLRDAAAVASAALLGYGALTVFGRWLAGHLSDRFNRPVVILPSTVAAAVGMTMMTWALWPAESGWGGPAPLGAILVVAGATLFGGAFGAVQNDTIVAMFRRAGPQGYGTASAVWNIGYDAGTGAGALSLGLVAQTLGFGPTFAITAIAIAACFPAALRLSRNPDGKPAPE